jgi:hypothetical protein
MKRPPVVTALLASDEPSVRWKVRVGVLGEDLSSPANRRLQQRIRTSPRVRALLDGAATESCRKWQGRHWAVQTLVGWWQAFPEDCARLGVSSRNVPRGIAATEGVGVVYDGREGWSQPQPSNGAQPAQPVSDPPPYGQQRPPGYGQYGQPQHPQPPYGQPQDGQAPYGQSQYGQAPYGQPHDAQAQYGQPNYAQPQYGQPQYGQPNYAQPQYGQPNYAQPQYGQAQYGQAPYGQPQYGQAPYGQASQSGFVPGPAHIPARKSATRQMIVGGALLAVGIVITIVTYQMASDGGTYVVSYGPVIGGVVLFVRGLIGYLRS